MGSMRSLALLALTSLFVLPALPGCASASDPASTTVVVEEVAGSGGEGGDTGEGGTAQGGAGTQGSKGGQEAGGQGGSAAGQGGSAQAGAGNAGGKGGSGPGGAGGSAQAGAGNAGGSAQAGQGQAGSGQSGSESGGAAGSGQAGQAQAGSGDAGQGQAGQAQAGSGQGGAGQAGSGQAGSGQAGGGAAGSGQGGAEGCAPLSFLSGVKIATRTDPGLTALYEDLNVSTCSVPVCFIDTLDLKDDQGNPLDLKVKLAPHFTLYEIVRTEVDPNGTGAVDAGNAYSTTVLVAPDLLEHLEQLRVNYGGAVNLTSGFRSPQHQKDLCQSICGSDQCTDGNGTVTCARNSRHMWGAAADMSLMYETAADSAGFAFVFHENGGTGAHLHVDMQSCQ
jgi:hypothetical protein